jgi:hypothetical protein
VGKDTRCNQPLFKHRRHRTHSECDADGKTDILNHRVEAAKGIVVDRGDHITDVMYEPQEKSARAIAVWITAISVVIALAGKEKK